MIHLKKKLYMKKWRKLNPLAHRRWPSSSKEMQKLKRENNPKIYKEIKDRYRSTKKYKKWVYVYNRLPHVKLANIAKNHTRRYKMGGTERLKKETLQLLYEDNIKRFGTLTCVLCKNKIIFGDDTIEHLVPLSRSGTNEYKNLGISHAQCNFKKKNLTMEEYILKRRK